MAISLTSTAECITLCGGTSSTSTTTDTSLLSVTTDGTTTIGDNFITLNAGDYTDSTGICNTTIGTTAYSNYDKSIIFGKEGDVFMDLKSMKFKVFSEEDGWIEYDIEDFSVKNKKVKLKGFRETTVSEIISKRKNRTVLIEKIPKKKDLLPFNNISGLNNIALGYSTSGSITAGTGNYTLESSSGSYVNYVNYDQASNINTGEVLINGNLIVSGSMKVLGNLTVSGEQTISNTI